MPRKNRAYQVGQDVTDFAVLRDALGALINAKQRAVNTLIVRRALGLPISQRMLDDVEPVTRAERMRASLTQKLGARGRFGEV